MSLSFRETVTYLEKLQIMPKSMPGVEKLKQALNEKKWFTQIDSKKVITIAGTNGKGTTAAALEALLLSAQKKVGLYTSPHLIQTTERIRVNATDISEEKFIEVFLRNKSLIEKYELTHFESLTLMAADYFFHDHLLDYVILEVGLGGTYDATNVFDNYYAVITALGLDHQNILGNTLREVAKNKFGIIKEKSQVIHHKLPAEVVSDFQHIIQNQMATSFEAEKFELKVTQKTNQQSEFQQSEKLQNIFVEPQWFVQSQYGEFQINIPGARAAENIMTALKVFEVLGFQPQVYLSALNNIKWSGRMQKISWPNKKFNLYLSGDHNEQGIASLIQLLRNYQYKSIKFIIGVGVDKACDVMFEMLFAEFQKAEFYLTVTPFKGRELQQYSEKIQSKSKLFHQDPIEILNHLEADESDLVVVTGSLYLVGLVLEFIKENNN